MTFPKRMQGHYNNFNLILVKCALSIKILLHLYTYCDIDDLTLY